MFNSNLIRKKCQKSINYQFVLFFYHLFFIYLAYQIRIDRGISDSHFYWAQKIKIDNCSWFDFANYGANFILFLNYPLIKLGLPFWFGFFVYGMIGFFGILKWIEFSEKVIDKIDFKGYNLLPILYFLPNLHYWTATLGKEPLVFLSIAYIFNFLVDFNNGKIQAIVAFLILLMIRPHVALLLLFSIFVVVIFQKKYSIKNRVLILIASVSIFSILSYMVFQLALIKYWDWSRIIYSNEYSILSFKKSRGYVPMLDYSIWYKLFSLNFRPLFFDAYTVWTFLASIENMIAIVFSSFAILFFVRFFNKIHFLEWTKIAFLFTLFSSLVYVQRYANFGIFMRTKIMFQPYIWIVILFIFKQSLTFKKNTSLYE